MEESMCADFTSKEHQVAENSLTAGGTTPSTSDDVWPTVSNGPNLTLWFHSPWSSSTCSLIYL